VKERIAEIKCEIRSRALMCIDEKPDPLRQMIEGTIPTKVNRRKDGTAGAVFDMLGAPTCHGRLHTGLFEGLGATEPIRSLQHE
jgi:hypothetical protein